MLLELTLSKSNPTGLFVYDFNILGADANRLTPQNCQFDIANANHGFAQYPDGFDLVHLRFVNFGLDPWSNVLLQVQKALKPGGIIIVISPRDVIIYDEDFQVVHAKAEGDSVSLRGLALI
jgi:hypothetical protein